MRKTAFGDPIIESKDDDLGLVEALQEAGDEIYAIVRKDEEGSDKFYFEILTNAEGTELVSSEPIFDDEDDVRLPGTAWTPADPCEAIDLPIQTRSHP